MFKRRQCTFPGSFKEPLHLQNHLRQTHEIGEKAEFDQLMRQSVPMIAESFSQSEAESSSGSETEDEESLIK